MHMMSAELSSFGFLVVTSRERMDFATPFVGELQRHISQPTNADDSYASGERHIMKQQGRENSNAATKQRSDFCEVQRIRQRANPCPLRSDTVRETAMASDYGPLPVAHKC